MSATFYDLLKFAKTGIAAPEMTHYDKLKALAMCKAGFPVKTLSGVPPISFQSDGTPLTAWSISGNMTQTGTPTPSAPIQPEQTGDKTGNLFDVDWYSGRTGITVSNDTVSGKVDRFYNSRISLPSELIGKTVTWSVYIKRPDNQGTVRVQTADNGVYTYGNNITGEGESEVTFVVTASIRLYINYGGTGTDVVTLSKIMLNTGSSPLPYEPYGYKLPLTLAGQTQTVYLSEPLRKIGDYADKIEASGTTGTVTRRIKKRVFDGTETDWHTAGSDTALRFYTGLNGVSEITAFFCSHFSSGQVSVNGKCTITSAGNFVANNSGLATTVAEWKTWLADEYAAGTPVCVWYVLATAQTETVTVPTLTPQKGINTLTVGTTLQPSEVSITGGIK